MSSAERSGAREPPAGVWMIAAWLPSSQDQKRSGANQSSSAGTASHSVAVPASPSTVAKERSRQLMVALMRSAPTSTMRRAIPERIRA